MVVLAVRETTVAGGDAEADVDVDDDEVGGRAERGESGLGRSASLVERGTEEEGRGLRFLRPNGEGSTCTCVGAAARKKQRQGVDRTENKEKEGRTKSKKSRPLVWRCPQRTYSERGIPTARLGPTLRWSQQQPEDQAETDEETDTGAVNKEE